MIGLVKMIKWLSISVVVIVLDQWSKYLVVGVMSLGEHIPVFSYFSWVRWHNDGAAFSLLAGSGGWARWFFVGLAVGFVGFLIFELRRLGRTGSALHLVYALIIGGALGNMIDRLLQGYVVDFLLFHYQEYYFPAFNVADAALSVGAGIWAVLLISEEINKRREPH